MEENKEKELEVKDQENEEELDEQSSEFQSDDEQQSIDRVESLLKSQGKEDEQSDETKEVEKPKEVKEELKPEILLIDDALASQYPVLKPYIGKPQSIIPDLYAKLQRELTKQRQIKPQPITEVKEPELGEMPDPVDDPKAFKEWFKQARERDRKEAKDEVLKEMESRLTPFQEQVIQKTQEDVKSAISEDLNEFTEEGKSFDSEDAINYWKEQNASNLYLEDGELNLEFTHFYDVNPKKFVQEVTNLYRLKQLTSNKTKTAEEIKADKLKADAEAKKKAADLAAKSIRDANNLKTKDKESVRFKVPDDRKELTAEEKLLGDVYSITEQENNV
jgi:hypothetical protein